MQRCKPFLFANKSLYTPSPGNNLYQDALILCSFLISNRTYVGVTIAGMMVAITVEIEPRARRASYRMAPFYMRQRKNHHQMGGFCEDSEEEPPMYDARHCYEMQLMTTYPSGAEMWRCPMCGHLLLTDWSPACTSVDLVAGDKKRRPFTSAARAA